MSRPDGGQNGTQSLLRRYKALLTNRAARRQQTAYHYPSVLLRDILSTKSIINKIIHMKRNVCSKLLFLICYQIPNIPCKRNGDKVFSDILK
jgi:hypothetical protein